jgi:hypothetical protein
MEQWDNQEFVCDAILLKINKHSSKVRSILDALSAGNNESVAHVHNLGATDNILLITRLKIHEVVLIHVRPF